MQATKNRDKVIPKETNIVSKRLAVRVVPTTLRSAMNDSLPQLLACQPQLLCLAILVVQVDTA